MSLNKIAAISRLAIRQTYLTKSTPNLANGMGSVRYQWGLGSHHGDNVDKPYYTYKEKADERKEKVKHRLEDAKEDLKGQYAEHKEGWQEARDKVKDDLRAAKDQITEKISGVGQTMKNQSSTFKTTPPPIKANETDSSRPEKYQDNYTGNQEEKIHPHATKVQSDRMAYEGNVWDGNLQQAKEGTATTPSGFGSSTIGKAAEKIKETTASATSTMGKAAEKIKEGTASTASTMGLGKAAEKIKETGETVKEKIVEGAQKIKDKVKDMYQ